MQRSNSNLKERINKTKAIVGRLIARALKQPAQKLFLQQYFYSEVWKDTFWMGHHVRKSTADLWSTQEIVFEVKPNVIIETGTARGGSALFYAHLCDLIGKGKIISIDHKTIENLPQHPRISYLTGSSVDPGIYSKIKDMIAPEDSVMVNLDSDHRKSHVLDELNIYSKFVSIGSYLIVEDTFLNGNPVHDDGSQWAEGPAEALDEFLNHNAQFKCDSRRERFMCMFHPGGYLKRHY